MAIHGQTRLFQENLGFLNNSQGWWTMENPCGFLEPSFSTGNTKERQSFDHQQQQSHSLHHQLHQMNQTGMHHGQSFFIPTPGNNIISNNHQLSVGYSQSLDALMEAQRQQLDQYLKLQSESLGLMLQNQRKQQLGLLMQKVESKTIILLKQKDAEIAHAAQSQIGLEGFLRKLEMESQEWQRMSQENEAMAESLNNTLEELREKAACCISNNVAEDAESCCDVNDSRRMMVCKGCNSRKSCMLFLPCRHLCSCKTCEAFLDCCPVCRTIKKASMEALL